MAKFFVLMAIVALVVAQAEATKKIKFEVKMNGKLNGVKTKAAGKVTGVIDVDKQMITGSFYVTNIKQVTMAHLHIGAAGVNGAPVAWLWPTDTKAPTTQPLSVSGKLTVPFTIKAADLAFSSTSAPVVSNFDQLVMAIEKGQIYANFHTVKYPAGEIRGQTMVEKSKSS